MNGYEITQIEKSMNMDYRLPMSYEVWAKMEHEARRARAQAAGEALSRFFGAVVDAMAGIVRQVRGVAAQCTGARLRHDH
jgi:hypothetical protein